MKVVKEIANCLLSFCLCLILSIGFAVMLLANTILSQEFVLKKLAENEYYEKIEIDLKNGIEEYQYQSGLPQEVFEDLYTSQMVKEDVQSVVKYLYGKIEITNHAQDVKEKISQNIAQYLSENQIVLKENEQKNVEDFEEIIKQVYEKKISVLSNYLEPIGKLREKADEGIKLAKQLLMVGFLVILGMIGLINRKDFKKVLFGMGRSLLASGILLELINFVITQKIDIKNILLFSQSLSDLLKEILQNILSQFCYFGLGFILIGLGMIGMTSFYETKKK